MQARASGGAGLPDGIEMSPEAMQSAMQTMAGLDPKDLEGMVSKMQASAGGVSAGGTNAGTSPLMGPDTDQFKQAAATLQVIMALLICRSFH